MIEIHRHDIIFHVFDYAYQTVTLVVTHRKLVAYLEQAVLTLPSTMNTSLGRSTTASPITGP